MIRRLFISVALVVVLLMGAGNAFADMSFLGELASSEGITAGPMKVHLGASLGERYDSNIYSASSGEMNDMITILTPGILVTVQTQRNKLEIGYSSDSNSYNDYDEENFTATDLKASYTLSSLGGFTFNVNDTQTSTTDPRPEQSTPLRTKHTSNTAMGTVDYEFPSKKFSLSTSYSQTDLDYDKDSNAALERRNTDISIGLYYKLLPKTSLFLEYMSAKVDYFSGTITDGDSTNHTTSVGLLWAPSAKMNGDIKVGFQRREYHNTSYSDSDDEMVALDANLRYKITETTKINFLAMRSMNETSYGGSATIASAAHYKANTVGFGISSLIKEKVTLDVNYALEVNYYNRLVAGKDTRKDNNHTLQLSVTYPFAKRLNAVFDYDYTKKDSDDSNNDELRSLASISLKYMM
jgi:predicted porin